MQDFIAIFLVLLFVRTHSRYDEELHYFKLAFGNEVSSMHYLSASDFMNSIDTHHRIMVSSMSQIHYFTCTSYGNASIASVILNNHFGRENIQTVYISQRNNAICFIAACGIDDLDHRMDSLHTVLRVWTPLPAEVKISAPLASRAHAKLSSLRPIELEVTFGMGTPSPSSLFNKSIDSVIKDLKQALSGALDRPLHSMASSSRQHSMWTKASVEAAHLSSQELHSSCGFESLQFTAAAPTRLVITGSYAMDATIDGNQSTPASAKLSLRSHAKAYGDTRQNLHEGKGVGVTPSASMCLTVLLAVLVNTPGCYLITDLPKYKPLMANVNPVVQSGEFGGGKMYHNIGLRGDGVVIGVAGRSA